MFALGQQSCRRQKLPRPPEHGEVPCLHQRRAHDHNAVHCASQHRCHTTAFLEQERRGITTRLGQLAEFEQESNADSQQESLKPPCRIGSESCCHAGEAAPGGSAGRAKMATAAASMACSTQPARPAATVAVDHDPNRDTTERSLAFLLNRTLPTIIPMLRQMWPQNR